MVQWQPGRCGLVQDHEYHDNAIDITGWKLDDNSGSFVRGVSLTGITSIAPGESVIFLETNSVADKSATFLLNWFGTNPPANLQMGDYTGPGVGLGTTGDPINIYNASGVLQANVAFGASPSSPFATFNNAAGLNRTTISLGTETASLSAATRTT